MFNAKRKWARVMACALFLNYLLSAGFARATDNPAIFELGPGPVSDENGLTNILGNSTDTGPDWADLFNANGTLKDSDNNSIPDAIQLYGGTAAVFIKDQLASGGATDDTVFSSGSSKNSDLPTQWSWGTGNVPAKDDIANTYAFAKIVNNQLLIYAGVERLDPSGDSHVDLEFNQKIVKTDKNAPCGNDGTGGPQDKKPCEFEGERTIGDIVVSMDFLQGGSLGTVTLHVWDGSAFVDSQTLTGEGCTNGDIICAFNNGGAINGGPWDNFNNHAQVITTLETNAFTEFGLNVSAALNLSFAPCFATIQVKTRSSQSFTAELKDFAISAFEQCSATVTSQIHSGASVGATHTATDIQNFSVFAGAQIHDKAFVSGQPGFPVPTGTVDFLRYTTANCTGTAVTQDSNVLLNSDNSPAMAESSTYTTTGGGFVSFKVHYDGDANYDPADGPCEPLTVNLNNSSVVTNIRINPNSSALNDTAVNTNSTAVTIQDFATVTGNGTIDPTGTVTFMRFSSGNCTGTPTNQDVTITADGNADGIVTVASPSLTIAANGSAFVSYVVSYSGDSFYQPSAYAVCEAMCAFPFNFTPAP